MELSAEIVTVNAEEYRLLRAKALRFAKLEARLVAAEARVRELEGALRTVSEESGCYCHEGPRWFRPNKECGVCAARRLLAPPRTQGEGKAP